jgi:MoxR-like ATPase
MAAVTPSSPPPAGRAPSWLTIPDGRDGRAYVMSGKLELGVKVALATGRPLLLRGDPGSGKSSLAAYIARERGWRYYEQVVTARSHAQDLLWTFDSIRRLADAQLRRDLNDHEYVEPGVLWWAFARDSAFRRGAAMEAKVRPATEPYAEINGSRSADHAVVLIDEIDKADPDLPNGLLVPLGSNQFQVTETGASVHIEAPADDTAQDSRHLIMVTTNEERELPQAFLRRCVVLWLEHPDSEQLVAIARRHFEVYEGGMSDDDELLARELAEAVVGLRNDPRYEAIRWPSTAEFLDALRACRRLHITVADDGWNELRNMVLVKQQRPG